MLRALTTLSFAVAATLAAAQVQAATPLDGVWLFDKAPSYPGVTMVQLTSQGGKPKGVVTTAWYGAMEMQNLTVKDGRATFELRNLNDKAHATREWTAVLDGQDLRQTSPEVLKLLTSREVIGVDQDTLGVQGKAGRREGATEVWKKPLADGSVALALFNRGDAPATVTVAAGDAGFGVLESVRDVWAQTELGALKTSFVVPPQGAVLLKARGR